MIYRQGDILLRMVDKLPDNTYKLETDIILRGEATGHAHKLVNGIIYQVRHTWDMYIEAKNGTQLVHDEHGPIDIAPGIFLVVRQREYDPRGNEFVYD